METRDGTRLSAAGEHRVAASFADAMSKVWTVTGRYPRAAATASTTPAAAAPLP